MSDQKTRKRRNQMFVPIIFASLLLSMTVYGIVYYFWNLGDQPMTVQAERKSQFPSNTMNKENFIGEEAVKQIAMTQFNGTIREIELKEKNGLPIYKVKIKNNGEKYKVYIHAQSGEIVYRKVKDD